MKALRTKCKLLVLSTDEPLAHTSDEDEDDEEDQDGLTPTVLRARFEDEVTVNDWLVPAAAASKRLDVIFALRSKISNNLFMLYVHVWRMCERKFNRHFGVSMLYGNCPGLPKADFRWKYRACELHHKTR